MWKMFYILMEKCNKKNRYNNNTKDILAINFRWIKCLDLT